ncbi:MAG: glyoxalase [Elusimicrobia bacterium]|nr:glyoxalase [Elusimicrobiota bacterium]
MKAHFILYVSDQKASGKFYGAVLGKQPELDVLGMTEFHLNDGAVLGLMPAAGIKRLIGDRLPDPMIGRAIPRAEVYLLSDEPELFHRRAIENGARELSPLLQRDWGHEAAYCLDPDGHVLAFARAGAAARS